MEFHYIGLAELMNGYEAINWQPLEKLLDQIAGRGHQTVFRIYLEYPAKTDVIPKFLLADGLKVHKYLNTNTQPLPPAKVETPFYYDWKAEYGLIADGKVCKTTKSIGKLPGLLPIDPPRVWNDLMDLSDVPKGKYTLALRIPNSLPNGLPLRFANATQDRDLGGWLSLTTVER